MSKIYIESEVKVKTRSFSVKEFPNELEIQTEKARTRILQLKEGNEVTLLINTSFEYEVSQKWYEAFLRSKGKQIPIEDNGEPLINEFLKKNSSEWHQPAFVFNLLRWMYDFNGDPSVNVRWSLDKEQSAVVGSLALSMVTYEPPVFNEEMVRDLIIKGQREPLAFDLLKEAQRMLNDNPRSSFILLAVALEVGVKDYIRQKCPQCGDLLTAMKSSPPMKDVVNSFLQTLDPKVLTFSDETKKLVGGLFNDRNNLVHTGSLFGSTIDDFSTSTGDKMRAYSDLVQDLLYHLEASLGHLWVVHGTHVLFNRWPEK